MIRRSILGLLIGLLALGGALLAFLLTMQPVPEERASPSASIGGAFTLVSTDGKTVSDQTYRGKWMLIYFGYTFCPDACPTALNNMSVALQKLGSEADKIEPLFITVDPKRDTVQVMAEYLKSFDHRIVGLTGSQAQTDAVAKAYHVYVAPQKSEGNDYLIDHSAYFYIMSPQGKFVNVIAGEVPGDQMADRLRKELARPST